MTNREYIISLFNEYGLNKQAQKEVYSHFEDCISLNIIDSDTREDSWKRTVRNIRKYLLNTDIYDKDEEQDVIEHNLSLMKTSQRFQDLNRVNRKEMREGFRKVNVLEALNEELITLLKGHSLKEFTRKHKVGKNQKTNHAVVQISDAHFNELIRPTTSINNKYDFEVASQRLKKYADNVKMYCKAKNVKNVVIALTGDLINSDRRKDEILSQATNRSSAVLLSVYLLEQFIVDLNSDFNISIASVLGNESRLSEEYVFSEHIAQDNWDHMIHNLLKMLFRDAKGIKFIEGSFIEKIISIEDFNILMLHGDKLKGKIEKEIQSKIGKYMQKNIPVHYVMYGHLHSANISDIYARSSSLCGANAYSDEGLNLISKASQNLYIIDVSTKSLDGIKIDLQDTTGIVGYDIKKELETYHTKSADKLHDNKVILQVVV